MLGAMLPRQFHETLDLYALAKGKSKSEILREALLWWMSKNGVTNKALLAELRGRYKYRWMKKRMEIDKDPETAFLDFMADARWELTEQKIPEYHIDDILNFSYETD